MLALSSKSKTELATALQRSKAVLSKAKEQTRAITARGTKSVLTVGGGAAVGFLRKEFGEGEGQKLLIPGTEVEADLVFGVGCAVLGVLGVAGDYSEELAAVGSGALAGYAALAIANS